MCRLPGPSGMTLWWPGVTSSALRGTDLHMYGGPYGGRCLAWCSVTKGWESSRTSAGLRTVCSAVTVSRCPRISTAVCFNCARGGSAACLRVQPGHVGGAYPVPGVGPFCGSQAELPSGGGTGQRRQTRSYVRQLRHPRADAAALFICSMIPGSPQ
jgi:hypothetical protein